MSPREFPDKAERPAPIRPSSPAKSPPPAPLPIGDVLIKYTFFGDADLSGVVDASDYTLIDNGFNSQSGPDPLSGWFNGDFNGDGQINGDDYSLIDNAYNTEQSASSIALPANQIATNTAQIAAAGITVARRVRVGPYPRQPERRERQIVERDGAF